MPIYEYECTACGHRCEELQKINDAVLIECPACRQPCLVKLVSAAGFRLSGNGWYETDFKTENRRNIATGSDAPATASDTEKNATKAETGKTTAKTEQKSATAPQSSSTVTDSGSQAR